MIEAMKSFVRLDVGGAADPYAPGEYTVVDIAEGAEVQADARIGWQGARHEGSRRAAMRTHLSTAEAARSRRWHRA